MEELGAVMVRSRRTKVAPQDKLRVVVSVLAGKMSAREAARRLGVGPDSVIMPSMRRYDSRATITAVRAECATAMLTEPSSMPANPPRP